MSNDLNDRPTLAKLIDYMSRAEERKIRLYVEWPGARVDEPEYREIDFLLYGYMAKMLGPTASRSSEVSSVETRRRDVLRKLEADIVLAIGEARGRLEGILKDAEGDDV